MNKKIIAMILSSILTASLFMTHIFASEGGVPDGSNGHTDGSSAEMMVLDSVSVNNASSERSSDSEEGSEYDSEDAAAASADEEATEAATEAFEEEPAEEYDRSFDVYGSTDPEGSESTITEEEGISESESEWLKEHGVTENEDGTLDLTDDNGDHWEFEAEDPELFRHLQDDEGGFNQAEIRLKHGDQWRRAALGDAQDPYSLILNPDFSYRYPSFIKDSYGENLPDVRCGMDISRYQGVISRDDWVRLKEEYGIDFVFIRAGYRGYGAGGSLNEDECCQANIENAHDAGVLVGIYYFSQAISEDEASDEARHCLDIISSQKDLITLPVVIDYEYSDGLGRLREADLSASAHTTIVNAFCDTVKSEGYLAGIYANKSMLTRDMVVEDIPDDNMIWMANFVCDSNGGEYSTSYDGPLAAWQFSSRFTGFGEGSHGLGLMKSANLDLDLWYGALPGEEIEEVIIDDSSDQAEDFEDVYDYYTVEEDEPVAEVTEPVGADPMSIAGSHVEADDVYYTGRPRSCKTYVRVYSSDGSRLAAGFDYDRDISYTYDNDTVVTVRRDIWGRKYDTIEKKAGEEVDMMHDIVPAGAVIRVTVTGKGRYLDPYNNTISTTFNVIER